MALRYAREKGVALAAVRRACELTGSIFEKLAHGESMDKIDRSPVTAGDYAAQAVICTILEQAFPDDPVVGEENTSELRSKSKEHLLARIVALANEALSADLQEEEDCAWGIGPGRRPRSVEELLQAIDRGNHKGGKTGRFWTVDPIDGTAGFLRGDQFSVCVSLIVDGEVILGLIGCPNLWIEPCTPESERGCIFVAVEGQGAEQIQLSSGTSTQIHIPWVPREKISFLESFEAAHSSHDFTSCLASTLGVKCDPIRMDGQGKYGCLSRGEGAVYMRKQQTRYQMKIWDHAPGYILVKEAGGVVTGLRGEPLNFGLGRTLGEMDGLVAAGKEMHISIMNAISEIGEAIGELRK